MSVLWLQLPHELVRRLSVVHTHLIKKLLQVLLRRKDDEIIIKAVGAWGHGGSGGSGGMGAVGAWGWGQ